MGKKRDSFRIGILVIILVIMICFFVNKAASISPFGANVTEVGSERAQPDAPAAVPAQAGNVTELNIFGYSTTQSWQGYFGNVSGTIQLADANGNVMYNWSQVNAEGEVYAVNQSTVSWSSIECFNFTSTTELNVTGLESAYNIAPDDVDGVDETFNLNNHPAFAVGTISFSSGECKNTKLFNNAGVGTFDEVLLYDSTNDIPVFASILSDDTTGFNDASTDFEMLVLEDGHNGDSSTTTYYFYIELNA